MPDILHRVGIKAPAAKVYEALTEEKGLAGWWTKNVKASPTVGAVDEFRFGDSGSNHMKVVELVPGKRVKWQCVAAAKEWIGTDVTFDLRPKDGVTVVLFAQRGWKEPTEFMHYCAARSGPRTCSVCNPCAKPAPGPRIPTIRTSARRAGDVKRMVKCVRLTLTL